MPRWQPTSISRSQAVWQSDALNLFFFPYVIVFYRRLFVLFSLPRRRFFCPWIDVVIDWNERDYAFLNNAVTVAIIDLIIRVARLAY
ncbi:hypothetical protein AYX13_06983 [Cryptococcus neoformans]|nr:hypothetical protein AYX13_06983 [Cryptococcus neoformans var. grubii]